MKTTLIVSVILLVLLLAWIVIMLESAPQGYEDEDGFHEIKD